MSKELGEIPFSALADYDDSDYLVFTALTLTDTETIDEIEDFFVEKGLIKDKKIIGMYRILGNKLGDEGRTDWLIKFTSGGSINPMVRLQMSEMGVKWLSDFIDNYGSDYDSDY
jgi:hypothetical protein